MTEENLEKRAMELVNRSVQRVEHSDHFDDWAALESVKRVERTRLIDRIRKLRLGS